MNNQGGNVHILLIGLLASMFLTTVFVVALQLFQATSLKSWSKLALDQATHAAMLSVDHMQAAHGKLVWNEAEGESFFWELLAKNIKLDATFQPAPTSRLRHKPHIHLLEFVRAATYPFTFRRIITVDDEDGQKITRTIDVTVYGSSVVAVMEVHYPFGGGVRSIVIPSVASVRYR